MSHVRIRIARVAEHPLLNALYAAWGYDAAANPSDALFVAELDGRPAGLVRRASENGITMLRGMYVDPMHHRQRIGSALLARFAHDLGGAECYCIPFAHPTRFYGAVGFAVIADNDAPTFLAERTRSYRVAGHDVLIMRRAANAER
jgi:GNAT superfamily N-acetyltransferase